MGGRIVAQADHVERLAESGWNTCDSVREGIARAGLPVPTARYLKQKFSATHWKQVDRAIAALQEHFHHARFGDEVVFGALLVPDPAKLDTRGAMDAAMRTDQFGEASEDFVDPALPAGELVVPPGSRDWTVVATVTGPAGVHFGSYHEIRNDPAPERYQLDGVDTRDLMVRQIWGARVLQSGQQLPDCEIGGGWTFTLFPGEELVRGRAVSGTVLYNKVRFRLGKPDRGTAVVRVCPALPIG
ncbi:hypothetical protein [Caldimonas brevitalea]|uniref:Uncharacterized protein n=1 Tax=Caldimonas brevitalea TaxID=413882 RepID=A0A0G3BL16_9BURK|nr:hypothetical protein [Caldimonas brevitalea]AKJ30092.1 hypothetical protein AAW51_3401 [Caldimonas brevitalea]